MSDFREEMTLQQARDLLRTLVEEGAKCPCCTQMAKVYRRKLNSSMARTLITMYRHGAEHRFVHSPSLPGDTHEASQLQWWGLVEEERALREDGGRTGWWRLTPRGTAFVQAEATTYSHARIYDSRCLGLTGGQVLIGDCIGNRFSYRELMAGV